MSKSVPLPFSQPSDQIQLPEFPNPELETEFLDDWIEIEEEMEFQ